MSKRSDRTPKERRNTLIGAALTGAGLLMLFKDGIFSHGHWWGVALIAVAAFAVGKVVGAFTSNKGMDLTSRNREDRPPEPVEVPVTGNTAADEMIRKGQEALRELREDNADILDPELTRQMNTLEEKCGQIFKTVAEEPQKAPQVRKFMNYYLPTTLKMLASYRRLQSRGVSPKELAKHRATLKRGLDMVNTACQKQLDNLYKENMLDITTDIDVLEQMLKRDGFIEGDLSAEGISKAVEEARTATAAILNAQPVDDAHEAPHLIVPADSSAIPEPTRRRHSVQP